MVKLVDFFGNMVRDNGYKIPQIRQFYKKCSWDLAPHLRAGGTFAEGVQKVITSPKKHEALSKWVPPDTPKGKGKFAKGSEKGGGKETAWQPKGPGKGKSWTTTPPQQAQAGPHVRPQCRFWQEGHCKFDASCKFAHGTHGQAVGQIPAPPAVPRRTGDTRRCQRPSEFAKSLARKL